MSLYEEAMEPYRMLDEVTRSNGINGVITEYIPGAEFMAAETYNNSMEARIGAAQGVTALLTIITHTDVILPYHKIIQRISDGKIRRITSDGNHRRTPPSADIDMRSVSAEEWELPAL